MNKRQLGITSMGPRVGSATESVNMTTEDAGSKPHSISPPPSTESLQPQLTTHRNICENSAALFSLKIKSSVLEKQKAEWVSLCSLLLLFGSLLGQALSFENYFITQSWLLYPRRLGMHSY